MEENYEIPMNKFSLTKTIRDNKYLAIYFCFLTLISCILVPLFKNTHAELYLCYIRQASFGYWILFCWLNFWSYFTKQLPQEKIPFNKLWPWIKNNKVSLLLTVLFPLILAFDAVMFSLMFLVPTGMAFSFVSTIWCFYWFFHLYII